MPLGTRSVFISDANNSDCSPHAQDNLSHTSKSGSVSALCFWVWVVCRQPVNRHIRPSVALWGGQLRAARMGTMIQTWLLGQGGQQHSPKDMLWYCFLFG